MNRAKIYIAFTFLLAFAVCVSAQEQMPKIVWKNLQEKYEKYVDVKPVILNASIIPIYMFSDIDSGIVYDFLELFHFSENSRQWFNVLHHGHPVKEKYKRRLMSSFELNPQESLPLIINNENWMYLTENRGLLLDFIHAPSKGKGKYKFQLKVYIKEKKKLKQLVSFSPEFEVIEEQKSLFDK